MVRPMTEQPTSPPKFKSVKVSAITHERIHNLAADLNGSADDAIRWLLNPDSVRIVVTPQQRERWKHEASATGEPLGVWVASRVEAAIQYGADPCTIANALEEIFKWRGAGPTT